MACNKYHITKDIDSYLAGVFDGEGCITAQFAFGVNKRRANSRLMVHIAMREKNAVAMFYERFGGTLRIDIDKRGHPMYQWYLLGSNTTTFLEVMSKLLVLKKVQAVLGWELARRMGAIKVRGKRPRGSFILSDEEINRRILLATEITRQKRPWLHSDT